MATITTAVYLDDAARTAGEIMTNNGGSLTVRTDTRWHANSPASMTGSLGKHTISATFGGRYILDGQNVRWMAYNAGTGNVPTIGSTISQGGVSGYLLGVWASLTSAPSAVGAAMPTTGYLKFRETTGGLFGAGALTGIGASATAADDAGWIEVVHDQAVSIIVPRLGDFTVRGNPSMFKLGTTSGAANQLMQVPTNGSATTYVPGVFVEDMNLSVTAMSWAAGVATLTWAGHGFVNEYDLAGVMIGHPTIIIEGSNPSGYNGSHRVTIVDANTLSFPVAVDPGGYVSGASALHFEFYPSIYAAGMIAANLGTDARSKFVCMETDGQIRFGHNGTIAIGYVPPAGKSVRVPNVFGRQCTTAARATNAVPHATASTRPDFSTTSAGKIDIQNFMTDWYLYFAQAFAVDVSDSCTFDFVKVSECAGAVNIVNGGSGISQSIGTYSLYLLSCPSGGEITDWTCHRYHATNNGHAAYCAFCFGQTYTRVKSGIVTFARATGKAIQATQSTNIKYNDVYDFNSSIQFTTSFNCKVDGLDHTDRFVGETTTVGVYAAYILSSCDKVEIRDVTFGLKGAIANVHPYLGIFYVGQSSNWKVRECGSRGAMLSGGSANNPAYIYASAGNNRNGKLQQLYMTPTRKGAISTTNSDKGMIYEHVYGDMTDTMVVASLNSEVKNCGGTNTVAGQASVYGTHFNDAFPSDTDGRVFCAMNEPTAETAQYVTYVAGSPKFTSAGGVSLPVVGDEIIVESSYFVKGCTALPNTGPVITGTNVTHSTGAHWGNHDIYYQIDTGAGYGGAWKDLTAANLSGETVDPATGFKLKYRIVCATANASNLIKYIRINTTSTLVAQTNNLYPLDTNTVTFTGLPIGADMVVLAAGTNNVLYQVDQYGAPNIPFVFSGAQTVDVGFIKPGYVPYYIRNLALTTNDTSLPISLTADRNYA